jgi:predicted aspartyl protease
MDRKTRHVLCLSIALAFGAVPAIAEPAAGPCTLRQAASLPMDEGYPGRIVVDVTIGGRMWHFLVDTGNVFSSVYEHTADELGLPLHAVGPHVEIYGTGGNLTRRSSKLPDLSFGSIKGGDIPVLVDPDPLISAGIDGVLAADILSQYDLDLDFANHKVNLVLQDHCRGDVVYWSNTYAASDFTLRNNHVELPMKLDGHDVTATLDTGAINTHLYDTAAQSLFGIDASTPGIEPIAGVPPGAVDQFQYRFKSLSIGGLAVNNPLIYIMQDRALASFERNHAPSPDIGNAPHLDTTDILLGMNVISKLHLYIAYKEHKIYLTDAGTH